MIRRFMCALGAHVWMHKESARVSYTGADEWRHTWQCVYCGRTRIDHERVITDGSETGR